MIGSNVEVHLHVLLVESQFLGFSGFVGALFLGGSLCSRVERVRERIHNLGADSIGGEGIGLLLLLPVDGILSLVHKLPIFLIFLLLLLSDEIGLFLLLALLLLFFFLQSLGLGSSNGFLLFLLLSGFLSFSLLLFGSELLLLFLGLKLGSLLLGFSFLLFFLFGVLLGLDGGFGLLFGKEVSGNLLSDSFLFFLLNQCLLIILGFFVALSFTLLFGLFNCLLLLELFFDEFLGELLLGHLQSLLLRFDCYDLSLQFLVELGDKSLGLVVLLVQISDLFEVHGDEGVLLHKGLVLFGEFILDSLKLSLAPELGFHGLFLLGIELFGLLLICDLECLNLLVELL